MSKKKHKNNAKYGTPENAAAYADCMAIARRGETPPDGMKAPLTKGQRRSINNVCKEVVRKRQETQVMAALPQGRYVDSFPEARASGRRFVLHVGPTNSGKTHDALQALEAAPSGVYLAPLRLLALEVGERMREDGLRCDIVTGEEADYADGTGIASPHMSSTVEMLDTGRRYDVAVIDEAQMLADRERGWSWTRAIAGVNAPVVHVCMAQGAEGIVRRLVELCGDEVEEIVEHERMTPLVAEAEPYDGKPQGGDALVCFSRKAVLGTAARLERSGIKASVVYGALPWQARKREAEKFRDGETDVVVATDSIGMGLNLPIRRVVFLEDRKYDGVCVRELTDDEWRQIAGRAGRLGMYDEGLCTTTTKQGNKALSSALSGANGQIRQAYVGFPQDVCADIPLHVVMKVWSKLGIDETESGILCKQPLGNAYKAACWIDNPSIRKGRFKKLRRQPTRDEEMRMVTVPFDMGRDDQREHWCDMVASYLRGDEAIDHAPGSAAWDAMPRGEELERQSLERLESLLKLLGISYGFLRQMRLLTPDGERAYGEYRLRVHDEVVKRLDGPKSLIGAYSFVYKDAEQEAEYRLRHMGWADEDDYLYHEYMLRFGDSDEWDEEDWLDPGKW